MQKWKLSIDFMMIIGKYFKTNNDFINLMKVNKKFKKIVLMYKFNPISDTSLFKRIETQHFYIYRDIFYRLRNMYQYIYWIQPYLINDYFKMINSEKCIVKDIFINKLLHFASCNGYLNENSTIFNQDYNLINTLEKLDNGYLIMLYNEIYFGFKISRNLNTYPKRFDAFYFCNDSVYNLNNADIFISTTFFPIRLNLRDRFMNSILTLYNYPNQLKLEIYSTPLLDKLPNLSVITNWLIISNPIGKD